VKHWCIPNMNIIKLVHLQVTESSESTVTPTSSSPVSVSDRDSRANFKPEGELRHTSPVSQTASSG
jgi:hypothetical protein